MSEALRDLLRQGADTIERPRLDVSDLVAQTERRLARRRFATATVGVAAVVLIAAGGLALRADDKRTAPALVPAETPTTTAELTPERIRAEGSVDILIPPTAWGLTVREYEVCDPSCGASNRGRGPSALEVAQAGRSALFEVRGVYYFPVWATAFDEDSVLVQETENTEVDLDGRLDGPVRYRLLQADGTELELQMLDDPAPATPGPDVVRVDDLASWIRGWGGTQNLYLVDDRAGTIQPLDVSDAQVEWWGPNYNEFLWGGGDCRVVWQAADGGFDHQDFGCADSDELRNPTRNGDPFQGWLRPGRMAAVEYTDNGEPQFVHVSIDYGATWQRVPIDTDDGCSRQQLAQPCVDVIAEALRTVE